MLGVFGNPEIVATELQGRFRPGHDKIVTRKFGAVARVIWPYKTAENVAAICGCDVRQAKRFLAGEYEAPLKVLLHIVHEMVRTD